MFNKITSKLVRVGSPNWPMPNVEVSHEPTFLFLLTPPYSGSTAIADFLAQSNLFGKLQTRYEGQWLIKGLCSSDRWRDSKVCNYESIRRVWLKKISVKKKADPQLEFIIEKSPPNMMRYREITSLFNSVRVVCNNRNPYANIASVGYRHHNFHKIDKNMRIEVARKLSGQWLRRSERLKNIIEKENYPLLTYEQFCLKPVAIFDKFDIDSSITKEFRHSYEVAVKDYPKQKITNMNEKQVSRLFREEKEAIRDVLKTQNGIVSFFGYALDFEC